MGTRSHEPPGRQANHGELPATTTEDYLGETYARDDPRASLQRLLKAGFLSQEREDVRVFNVTGTYKAEPPGCSGLGVDEQLFTFTLSMQPGRAAVTGNFTYDSWFRSGQRSAKVWGPVEGEVRPDGVVRLTYGSSRGDYNIKSEGQNISLDGPA